MRNMSFALTTQQILDGTKTPLSRILGEPGGTQKEGMPNLTAREFINMLCRHGSKKHDDTVTRIEFEYTE